jgi:hypothetical protein
MQLLGSTPLQVAALVLAAPCCKLMQQQVLVHQHQKAVCWAASVVAFPMQQLVQ